RKVENVMLVSSFLAAAALAQSLGSATGYARNALLYVEPDSATLAVVNTADGAIMDVQREQLPDDDDQAVATLVNLVSAAEALEQQPEGLLVVGSGRRHLAAAERARPSRDGAGPRRRAGLGPRAAVRLVDRSAGLRPGPRHRLGEPARRRARIPGRR